jgi:hypothetical protein
MTLRKSSIFFRALILGAQGVFYNLFCANFHSWLKFEWSLTDIYTVLMYMISPRACHRFVGYLEEEAVLT